MVHICEYSGNLPNGWGSEPALASYKLELSSVSKRSEPFTSSTHMVRLWAEETCHIKFGNADVSASSNDVCIPADTMISYNVEPGMCVAVLENE